MKERDYSLQDEEQRLKRFLIKNNILVNHNYLRMERGSKPCEYKIQSFVFNQLRTWFFTYYFLVFTHDCIILLVQDKNNQFSEDNMLKIKHSELTDFSFEEIYRNYCISFIYSNEKYYFYLGKRIPLIHNLFDWIFKSDSRNYLYDNFASIRQRNFMGLYEDNDL